MAVINYIEAINQALKEEMRRDERVVIWGEDMISMNGVHGQTRDIYDEFGGDRIRDTPICEQAITGMAIGAAYRGLRPIGVYMNASFGISAFDGMFLQLGCSGRGLPVVLYGVIAGPREDNGHGTSPEALCMQAPYLKVVMPSTPYDVKGLLKTAIRDDCPVVFWDHAWCFYMGQKDGTIERGANVQEVLAAAHNLEKEGISVEVVDLRTIVPLDVDAIVKSARKTGRLLIVHEAMKRGGAAGEILWRVAEEDPELITSLKTPFRRLAAKNLPLDPTYGAEFVPSTETIAAAVKEMVQ